MGNEYLITPDSGWVKLHIPTRMFTMQMSANRTRELIDELTKALEAVEKEVQYASS